MKTNLIFIGLACTVIFSGCETQQSSRKVILASQTFQAQPGKKPPYQELVETSEKNRNSYVAAHPDLSPSHKEAILKGGFAVGMSEDEVQSCYGTPVKIEEARGEGTKDTLWYYFGATLIFREGKLIRWVTS